jgi:hypothetical protein
VKTQKATTTATNDNGSSNVHFSPDTKEESVPLESIQDGVVATVVPIMPANQNEYKS